MNPDWQVIGALVPFYNHSSLGERGEDYWQVMGGAVAHYTRNDRLWWLFGVVFDDSDFGTSVLPYVGASLILNERWSVSAILPWPQVIYAPSKDWFVSLGASYSGNSWAIDTGTGKVGLNLSGFDFGFGGGMRLKGPLWLEGAVGVGGLRALTINDGEVSGPSIDVSSSPFVNISLTFRPSFTDRLTIGDLSCGEPIHRSNRCPVVVEFCVMNVIDQSHNIVTLCLRWFLSSAM